MQDWKNKFQRTVGMNTAIVHAEQQNFLTKKVIEDLENKNRTLHKCAYTAHKMIEEFLETDRALFTHDVEGFFDKIRAIKTTMEEILSNGSDNQ
jgi:FtsZ-binding cell division protein ZapB